ncbi:MAG: sensor domain-containing diguanylate cyclase [Candidatus Omnitrophota bacterium]
MTKTELEGLFVKTKTEMVMLSEVTNAMMQSLELDQVLYTILTALTSHDGLGFDRAMFFLVNDRNQTLEGKMGIGPHSAEEADKVWHHIDDRKMPLANLIKAYEKFKNDPESKLNSTVKDIIIPLREDTGILALTILEGMPFEINTEEAKSRVNDEVKGLLNMDFFVTVPLKTRNRTLGAILVDNILSRKAITKDHVRILNMFADHAAMAIENSRLYEKTVHLSRMDWLTGLWNTRYFNEILEEKLQKADKEESHLALLLIDIDNFKNYNDTLGHQKGDQAIKRVASILHRYSRKSDFVCRYGGEEFCTIMSNVNRHDANIIADRLRSEVESSFKHDDSIPEDLKLTISLGLAVFPIDGTEKDDLIRKADLALYQAKQAGKNRTCVYSPELK